jgi:hypothetical protein
MDRLNAAPERRCSCRDNGTMKLHCQYHVSTIEQETNSKKMTERLTLRSIMRNARTVGLCHGVQPFGEKIGGDVILLK